MFKCTKCGKTLEVQSESNCPYDGAIMIKVEKSTDQLVNEDNKVYILNEGMV